MGSIFQILTLVGALCLFLFGMKTMSEGIQKLAGEKMRSILSAMTANRFLGVFTGFFVTTLVQSSSASTVMLVSFVNAGLLTLVESVGVIMGANIGTTTTAWLISFLGFKLNISALSIPIIGIAFPMLLLGKNRMNSLGETLLGFALLFMGLQFLKDSVPDLHANPEIFAFLEGLTGYGFYSILLFLGLGTILTIILQSSSATMALTLVMCNYGWIGYEHGAAIVLGENIGTTVTANLAALMGNINARRTALAHTFFNIFGVIWMLIIFRFVINGIDDVMISFGIDSPFKNPESVPFGLAIFHTTFNIGNTLLLIWFVKYLVKIVEFIMPSKGKVDERSHLEYFHSGFLNMAEVSALQARKETKKFCELSHRMFKFVPALVAEKKAKEIQKAVERIKKYEEITDRVEEEITSFLANVMRNHVSPQVSEQMRRMRIICSEAERIADVCHKMALVIEKKKLEKVSFSPKQSKDLNTMFDLVDNAFKLMLSFLDKGEHYSKTNIEHAIAIEKQINEFRDKVFTSVIKELEEGNPYVKSNFYFNKLIMSCEKIGDTILNINEAQAGINIE
jgi:phosphate:Na+ symporter